MSARKIFAELHVRRRTVVDRPDADVEELAGDVARFLGQRPNEWFA